MPVFTRALFITTLGAVTLLGAPAVGANSQFGIGAGAQGFVWTEYRSSDDSKLLEEEGPRYTGHLLYDNFDRADAGFVHGLELAGQIGSVDYDGQTLDGIPIGTTTDYIGARADWRGGLRYLDVIPGLAVDLLFGLGLDYWEREIKDTVTPGPSPAPVQGYLERYTVVYVSAGVGFYQRRPGWDHYWQLGFRHPLDITEKVSAPFNVELAPGGNTSGFIYWNLYRHTPDQRRDWAVTLYFDSLRFSDSSPAASSLGSVYQPASDQNVFGARVSRYF